MGHPVLFHSLERNQSHCVLLSLVQGHRPLHPTDEDLSVGTLVLVVAST
jgi:hypothetical protein